MSNRIHFSIHYWWCNRNYFIKFISRYHSSRHILRSSSLPLRSKNGSSICNLCSIHSLIPSILRSNTSRTTSKSTIRYNIYRSKSHILPPTLLRTKRYTSPIFRLSWRVHKMKCRVIIRIYVVPSSPPIIYLHPMRSLRIATKSSSQSTHTYIHRMKWCSSTRLP